MEFEIGFAAESNYTYIAERDRHILEHLIKPKINAHEILILRLGEAYAGWLRFGYFWDNTPFMNLLWLDEEYRSLGYGSKTVRHWEELMRNQGHKTVLTSTQSNEGAQHFYRKLGYTDAGCLLQEDEPLEILLQKKL